VSAIRTIFRVATVALVVGAAGAVTVPAMAEPTVSYNEPAAQVFTALQPSTPSPIASPDHSRDGTKVDIYFVPHQDDEVLSMGALIAQSTAAGREVWIVNYTDGRASDVCGNKGSNRCQSRGLRGIPVSTFIAMRDAELLASSRALGVPADHVSRDPFRLSGHRLANSRTTVSRAARIIAAWHDAYPNARFTAMSWNDDNSDHAHMGEALRQAVASGRIASNLARFTEFRRYWSRPNAVAISDVPCASPQCNAQVLGAAAAYRRPYGIGWASVPLDFQALVADPKHWVATHGPS